MSRKLEEEAERLEKQVAELKRLKKKEQAGELSDDEHIRLSEIKANAGTEIKAQIFVGVATLAFAIFLAFWMFSGDEETEAESERKFQQRIERSILNSAIDMCHKYVQDRLRTPSTAKFPSSERSMSAIGNRAYQISGAVDAQNAFGAAVRNRFTCQIQHIGDGDWRLVDRNWNLIGLEID